MNRSFRPGAPKLWALSIFFLVSSMLSVFGQGQTNGSSYTWTTFAGATGKGSVDGVGSAAQFNQPSGVTVDTSGNLYVADTAGSVIRKITPAGVVTTIAGLAGSYGFNDGTNSAARFTLPSDVALDHSNHLFVADQSLIREMMLVGTNWAVTTIAGLSQNGYGSADGTNSDAQFGQIIPSLCVDATNNLFVADAANYTIRKMTLKGTNWVVTTIAGLAGNAGSVDGTNSVARFHSATGVCVDRLGNLFVVDNINETVRRIRPVGTNWVVTTIAGTAGFVGNADGTNGAASFNFDTRISYFSPRLTVDTNDNLYVTDQMNTSLRKISPVGTNWVVTTMAGGTYASGSTADGTGTNATFAEPVGITIDPNGNLFLADPGSDTIRKITSVAVVSTVAGLQSSGIGSVNGVGNTARFFDPGACAVDHSGNIFVADTYNHIIRFITSAGEVSTVAGSAGYSGSADGAGSLASFYYPQGIAVDAAENVYVADTDNHTIRKIAPSGLVTTIAGQAGVSGSADGTNGVARFYYPQGVAVDAGGNLYISDSANYTVRRMTPVGTNWVVTTIAGQAGATGNVDGTNNAARFGNPAGASFPQFYSSPRGLVVDAATNIYLVDTYNATIRKIRPAGTNWVVTTIAGQVPPSFTLIQQMDGTNTGALFTSPYAVALDAQGDLYVCDEANENIRKMTPSGTNWIVTTIGGSATSVAEGSVDGAGYVARFAAPSGIAVDSSGNIFVADSANNTIRKGIFTKYGANNLTGYAPSAGNAALSVTLTPNVGGWRLPWEQIWHNSGDMISGLPTNNYVLAFRSVPGYLVIQTNITVPVLAGVTNYYTNQYLPTASNSGLGGPGSLTVDLSPVILAGTGWRFLGESTWRAPGTTASGLLPDVYFIEFEPVSGYSKPVSQAVQIFSGQNAIVSAGYLLAQTPPANVQLPVPVDPSVVSDLNDYPFGFNGQLQSDTGFGSGVAVQANVVLTAAHVVFNDETLAYVGQVFWYLRQQTSVPVMAPQNARGWYVLSGYAAQRTNDLFGGLSPGQSSPQSRNLDVAAVYFASPAAGGGYSGYLPSDAAPNSWLTGNSAKMLVGYPVDGSLFGDASIIPGGMYEILPQMSLFNLSTDPVSGQEVYTANWFLSYPGNSGGPVEVQYNGYYYPAAVYLGTLYNGTVPYASAVRAIDSQVVNMITNAQVLGDSGTNGTGGGVTVLSSSLSLGAGGFMQWAIGPASAVRAGAAWQLVGENSFSTATNYTELINTTNTQAVHFKSIPGWIAPTNRTVSVPLGYLTVYAVNYTVSNPVLSYNPASGLGFSGATGSVYRLESRTNLILGSWVPVSTNTITAAGFNLLIPSSAFTNKTSFYRATWLSQ